MHSGVLLPLIPPLSSGEFLGEMSGVLHSRAPLPLIPRFGMRYQWCVE